MQWLFVLINPDFLQIRKRFRQTHHALTFQPYFQSEDSTSLRSALC